MGFRGRMKMALVAASTHSDQDYPLRSGRTKLLCLALAEHVLAEHVLANEPSLNDEAHRQVLAAQSQLLSKTK